MTGMADPGASQLLQMIRGYWVSQTIGTFARFEIADHLADGPLESAAVAQAIECDPDATFRLLRGAVHVGIVSVQPDGRFCLTSLGELLRSSVKGSMRELAIGMTAAGHWLPWSRLELAVRQGKSQAKAALGHELFDYYAANPIEGSAFTGAMADLSETIANELTQALDAATGFAVDIGGASGAIIAKLLEANPSLRAAILERGDVVPRARAAIARRGLSSRCEVIEGDFFESVPDADLLILKSIIHDWNDRQSVQILGNCARALRPDGRVVLVERVLPEHGDPGPAALIDLNMLVLLPGRERTVRQYAELLRAAGLRLNRVIELPSAMQAIEASPVT
jgi:SAM-dependent methyltransferase